MKSLDTQFGEKSHHTGRHMTSCLFVFNKQHINSQVLKALDTMPGPATVSFFPELHNEVTKPWATPFPPHPWFCGFITLTTLNAEVVKGTQPKLSSNACLFSSYLVEQVYTAAGQAASALHVMVILQVLFGDTIEDFARQVSVVKNHNIKPILPLHSASR